jgi:hypothetical protein
LDSKIAAIKKGSSIFLAILMFTGTIALSYPSSSFRMGAEEAQAQPYYSDAIKNRYNSYEPTSEDSPKYEYTPKYTDRNSPKYEYPPKYTDRNSYYNNYESSTTSEAYGIENNDRKSYGKNNDNYDVSSEYPSSSSYKPNSYKPAEYPSSYGGKDNNNYYKSQKDSSSSKKSVDINKVKCINDNLNIEGENTGNITIGKKGKGSLGAYSSAGGGGYGGSEGYYDNGYNKKKDKDIDCIINNNNTNTNIGGGNQTIPPEPPEQKANLKVTKNVTCFERIVEPDSFPSVLQLEEENKNPSCADLLGNITADQFNIQVTDDNPVPSQFPGSEAGTIVTLGAGAYTVTEDPDETSIAADLATLGGNITGPNITFTGQCSQTGVNSTSAAGTIVAGESQTCILENHFTIEKDQPQLTVFKNVTCEETIVPPDSLLSALQGEVVVENKNPSCADLLGNITADQFNINVTDSDGTQSIFDGSETGTTVTLDEGDYTVNETAKASVFQDLFELGANISGGLPVLTITGDCGPTGAGTIVAGESQTCILENHFTIEKDQPQLTVFKNVTCTDVTDEDLGSVHPNCTNLLGNITENQFNITVTGTNPTPSEFPGSEAGTIVTLDAGAYTVTEDPDETSIAADLATLGGNVTGTNISITGDCTQTGVNSTSATGTIVAGESQTCNLENNFVINNTLQAQCEDCFRAENDGNGFLPPPRVADLDAYLANPANIVQLGNDPDVNSRHEMCEAIVAVAGTTDEVTETELRNLLNAAMEPNLPGGQFTQVLNCLGDLITRTT